MLRLKSGIMTDDVREFIEEVVRGGVWKILRWGGIEVSATEICGENISTAEIRVITTVVISMKNISTVVTGMGDRWVSEPPP
jgi:hypothetical protein